MKNLYTIILFLLCVNMFSQKLSSDAKIKEVYATYYEEIFSNDKQLLINLNNLLENRIQYIKESEFNNLYKDSKAKIVLLSTVPLFNKFNKDLSRDKIFNKETFNPLKYNLKFYSQSLVAYKIDDTEWLLIIHPQKQN